MASNRRHDDQSPRAPKTGPIRPIVPNRDEAKLVGGRTRHSVGLVVSGANTPDGKLLEPTLEAIVIERPNPTDVSQHLCLDKAYSGARTQPSPKYRAT